MFSIECMRMRGFRKQYWISVEDVNLVAAYRLRCWFR